MAKRPVKIENNGTLPTPNGRFLEPFVFVPNDEPMGEGRPWRDTRARLLNGVFLGSTHGCSLARFAHLAIRLYQTCHRRFQYWQRSGLPDSLAAKNWPKIYETEGSSI